MALSASSFMQFCVQFSTIAVLWYDYALTWTREVEYYWTKPFTISTLLYILCRYAMVANVLYALAMADKLPKISCDTAFQICAILSVLGRVGIITVWGLRTYAVFHGSKIILVIFGSLQLIVIGLSILHVTYVSCSTTSNQNEPVLSRVAIFTVIYEVASAVLTTVRSVQTLNRGGPWRSQQNSLTFLILREGLIYFGVITSLTIPGTFAPELLNAYALPLSGLMTARFLLKLREFRHRLFNPETDEVNISAIQFKRSSTRWTIDNVLGDDPLLMPAEPEINLEERPSGGASLSRTGD